MAQELLDQSDYALVAGQACLDLANTVGGLRGAQTTEYLGGYADFAGWATQAQLVGKATGRALAELALTRPEPAARIFARVVAVREAIYALFSAVAAERRVPAEALAAINAELPDAMGRVQVEATRGGFEWKVREEGAELELPLQAVVRETAELLTSGRLDRVRECAGDTCGWLFLDETRNHSRQWCDMRGCGNRAKVRRHRARHRR
ncbi:MAG TPA: CGNR zinc finger domain-containing protein [Opitutus sp.]|nr:CGNR zinc finger domain-containing protein [Opitutus sp.]